MIEKLVKILKEMEKNWRLESFPQTAYEFLEKLDFFPESLSKFEQNINAFLQKDALPTQLNLSNSFGEPSLTIFNNGKFALDIYFWRHCNTIIHSHAFRGAFRVLYGKSLHETFDVKPTKSPLKSVQQTEISLKSSEFLSSGSVRKIQPGFELTHRVLHLSNPTVSLCLRTVNDTTLSQWHYLNSGISYKHENITSTLIKQILYFSYLYENNPSTAEKYLEKVIKKKSDSQKLSLYEAVLSDQFGLNEEVSFLLVDFLRLDLVSSPWFSKYENHYQSLEKNLSISLEKTPPKRFFCHAINSNYATERIDKMMRELNIKDIAQEGKEIIEDGLVFSDEFFIEQTEKVQRFCDFFPRK